MGVESAQFLTDGEGRGCEIGVTVGEDVGWSVYPSFVCNVFEVCDFCWEVEVVVLLKLKQSERIVTVLTAQ
jgi:hypothetical protein